MYRSLHFVKLQRPIIRTKIILTLFTSKPMCFFTPWRIVSVFDFEGAAGHKRILDLNQVSVKKIEYLAAFSESDVFLQLTSTLGYGSIRTLA